VVADRDGVLEPLPIETGVTDLDRVEIVSGLGEGDKVLVLPSSSLLETQERLQNFMRGRGGIPGLSPQAQDSQVGSPAATPRAGRGGDGARPADARRP
jgi:hypothetical protein